MIDALAGDDTVAKRALDRLDEASRSGDLIICDVAYSEASGSALDRDQLDRFLQTAGIRLTRMDRAALYVAGTRWVEYSRRRGRRLACAACGNKQVVTCERCGNHIGVRQHMIADFLVGAHAVVHADGLLTRDRGYYRTYFPDLTLL